MKRQITLKFHTDPGHGWLEVKTMTLVMLGIVDDISGCSYLGGYGHTAYLEEDCDAGILMNALKERDIQVTFEEVNEPHNDSFIRKLPHYNCDQHPPLS